MPTKPIDPSRWTSSWILTSLKVLDATLAGLPTAADARTIRRAVREAYPFGERRFFPYKQWLKARRLRLWTFRPNLFPKPRILTGGGRVVPDVPGQLPLPFPNQELTNDRR